MSEVHKSANNETPDPITVDNEYHLDERDGDITMTDELLKLFDLFTGLKKPIKISSTPGSIVIRTYRRGDVICATGQEGGTAFYVLRAEEEARIRQAVGTPANLVPNDDQDETMDSSTRDRHVLSIWFPTSKTPARPKGFLKQLFSRSEAVVDLAVPALVFDGDAAADSETPDRLKLRGGDIFGEMSCKSHAPRAATIIANVNCLLLEMNRNVFERLDSDEKYKVANFQKFKARTLDTFLRQLQLFRNLTEQQIQFLNKTAELLIVKPGAVICEEGETSTKEKPLDVFIVRNGCVQVTKYHRLSLRSDDITNWSEFCKELDALELNDQSSPEATKTAAKNPPAGITGPASERSAGSESAGPRSKGPLGMLGKQPLSQLTGGRALSSDSAPSPLAQQRTSESQPENTASASVKVLITKPSTNPPPTATPAWLVKSWLCEPVLAAIGKIANGEPHSDAFESAKEPLIDALNQLTKSPDFLSSKLLIDNILQKPRFARKTATYPKGLSGIKDSWKELELRSTGLDVLSEIFPQHIRSQREKTPPPQVLRYLTRGDCFGELAVVSGKPRIASCVAYSHPSKQNKTLTDPKKARTFGEVELVRIPGKAFLELKDQSSDLGNSINQLITTNTTGAAQYETQRTDQDFLASPEFQDMGLFQGSQLLTIDLNKCTRCGDCVEACINTHADGNTRLYLDGPRFDHFLVPSACRSCLNPVCMIGCPVGSIRRGDNGQIEIKDWCIGCRTCAENCPYDSIQMHDLGVIREDSPAWMYAPKSSVGKNWNQPDRWYTPTRDGVGWLQITSPVLWQGEFFRRALTPSTNDKDGSDLILCFRHEFRLPPDTEARSFRLSINRKRDSYSIIKGKKTISQVKSVYLNGKELKNDQQSNWDWEKEGFDIDRSKFHSSVNLLAIELCVKTSRESNHFGDLILSAGIDAVHEANQQTKVALGKEVMEANTQLELEVIANRAVVCDLCSHLPGKQPACVSSCPHDAAIRRNPLVDFPT